jgi:hypothetical protein
LTRPAKQHERESNEDLREHISKSGGRRSADHHSLSMGCATLSAAHYNITAITAATLHVDNKMVKRGNIASNITATLPQTLPQMGGKGERRRFFRSPEVQSLQ